MWSSDLPNNKVLSSVVLKSLKGSNWLIFTVEVATAAFSSFQTPLASTNYDAVDGTFQALPSSQHCVSEDHFFCSFFIVMYSFSFHPALVTKGWRRKVYHCSISSFGGLLFDAVKHFENHRESHVFAFFYGRNMAHLGVKKFAKKFKTWKKIFLGT